MKQQKPKLVNTIRTLSIVSLVLLAVIIMLTQIAVQYREFNRRAEQMRAAYTEQQKTLIKREVERVIKHINHQHSLSEDRAKTLVKQRVYEAHAIAQNLYQQHQHTKTDAEIQQLIVDALRPIRFNRESGYYFIHSLQGHIALVADRPEMEGRHYSTLENSAQQTVIRDMIALGRQSGEGFYPYTWTKPGETGDNFAKVSFVKRFEPYQWNIGSGVYIDDIETEIKAELLDEIIQMRYGQNDYFFVDNWDGVVLTHGAQPELIGQNIWNYEDPNGVKVVQNLIAAAQTENGDFVYYAWQKPNTGEQRPKISYAQGVHAWQWIVGTGVYMDDIETDIAALQANLRREIQIEIAVTVLITAAVVALSLFGLHFVSRRLLGDFSLFTRFFNKAAYADTEIEQDKVRFEELHRIAGDANKMLRDKIAAQRSAETEREQLAVTLRSIGDGVITTDINGNVLLMNPAAEKLTGWREADAVGKALTNIFPIIHETSRETVTNPVTRVIKTGQLAELSNHTILQAKDGAEYNIADSAAPIRAGDSQIKGVVLVFRDVTEQLKIERERVRLRKLESVGTLAGGIAHDFNNLLSALLGNMELAKLCLPANPGKAQHFLEAAGNSMETATTLTRQLLTFAKGGAPLTEILRIGPTLAETAQFALRGSNIKLHTNIAPDLWAVEADKGQLGQVITNLVINAKQAMPAGGIVTVAAENVELSDHKYVQITVQDKGEGITPHHLDKIFDPYFTTKQNGSGLGLASSHAIISKHNGAITVNSELNRGTTFTLRLPAAADAEKGWKAENKAAQIGTLPMQQISVLALDDEKDVREMLGAMLRQIGCRVDLAADGQEAIAKYRAGQYHLVITDLTLPGSVGGEVIAQQILALNPQAEIIVSSGYATGAIMANYKAYGFRGRIVKPYRFAELQKVVSQTLKNLAEIKG